MYEVMNKWIEWSPRSLRLLVVRKWLTLNWFDLILMVLVSTQSSNSRAVLDSLTAARFAGPKANVTNHGDYEEHWLLLWLPPKRISTTNFQPRLGHGVYWSIKNPFMTSSWQVSALNNQPIWWRPTTSSKSKKQTKWRFFFFCVEKSCVLTTS